MKRVYGDVKAHRYHVCMSADGIAYQVAARKPEGEKQPRPLWANATASSLPELFEEIKRKRRLPRHWRTVGVLAAAALVFGDVEAWPPSILFLWLIVGFAVTYVTFRQDQVRRSVTISYDLDTDSTKTYTAFRQALGQLSTCRQLWRIKEGTDTFDRKYHAGASSLVQRSRVNAASSTPPDIQVNIPIAAFIGDGFSLYFLPDFLLIYRGTEVEAIRYKELKIECDGSRFIEGGPAPSDAEIVGHTWQYVNKKGGPDGRFKDNRRLPVCLYEDLRLSSDSGIHEVLQASKRGFGRGIRDGVLQLRALQTPATRNGVGKPSWAESNIADSIERKMHEQTGAEPVIDKETGGWPQPTVSTKGPTSPVPADGPQGHASVDIVLRKPKSHESPNLSPEENPEESMLASPDKTSQAVCVVAEATGDSTCPLAKPKPGANERPARSAHSIVCTETSAWPPPPEETPMDVPVTVGMRGREGNELLPDPAATVPECPQHFKAATWIPPRTTVEVSGVKISSGMFYLGIPPRNIANGICRSQIDPRLPVGPAGDYTTKWEASYWSGYAALSPRERRAYLNWLEQCRSDHQADIGYVHLFFDGLARRVLTDARDPKAVQEFPLIAAELARLITIYGDKSAAHTFKTYAIELLEWITLADATRLYEKPIPAFTKSYDLPKYIKLALGQAALDGVPVPASLALSWVILDPNTYLRTPATRCARQFEIMFTLKYGQAYGEGMVIPKNKTKLNFDWYAFIAGFLAPDEIQRRFGWIPDVTVLTRPIEGLRRIAGRVTDDLQAYSRLIGRNPELADTIDAALLLPQELWPPHTKQALEDIKDHVTKGVAPMSLRALETRLGAKTNLKKDSLLALAKILASMHIGFEPDVLSGVKLPKPEDHIILFALSDPNDPPRDIPGYQGALLTVQLASCVVSMEGGFGDTEMNYLLAEIQGRENLVANHRQRLAAQLRLLQGAPASLAYVKRRLEATEPASKRALGSFVAHVTQVDGMVSRKQVQMLEKIYQILEINPQDLSADLHAWSGAAPSESRSRKAGFYLDTRRITQLQDETKHVARMMTAIFVDEKPTDAHITTEVSGQPETKGDKRSPARLLGLDDAHAALARLMLTRSTWSREDLLDAAGNLNLMLDGALERVNDASFEAFDMPFFEGDSPICINEELKQRMQE